MIRAVFRDGTIQPLEPLPKGWGEGQELQISEADPADDPEAIEQWCREMSAQAKILDDPGEWEILEKVLAEADREAKEQVRREMDLE